MNEYSLHWIHCNRCFNIYAKKLCAFYILACHHIVCDRCAQLRLGNTPNAAPIYKCCVCKKEVRGRQLDNNMPQHIKELFHPQPYLDDLPVSRILSFQMKHRQHLIMATRRIARNRLKILHNFQLVRAAAKKKFESLENMKRARRRLVQRVRLIIARRKEKKAKREQHTANIQKISAISSQRPRYPVSTHHSCPITQPIQRQQYTPRMPHPNKSDAGIQINSFPYKRNQSFIL